MFSPFQPDVARLPVDEESEVVPFSKESFCAVGTDGKTVGVKLRAPTGVLPREQMWRARRVLHQKETDTYELVVDSQLMLWKRVPVEREVAVSVLQANGALGDGLGDAIRRVMGGEG